MRMDFNRTQTLNFEFYQIQLGLFSGIKFQLFPSAGKILQEIEEENLCLPLQFNLEEQLPLSPIGEVGIPHERDRA